MRNTGSTKYNGKAISRTFVPALACEEYYESFFAGLMTKDIPMILSALTNRPDLDAETMDKLEKIVRDKRSELGY